MTNTDAIAYLQPIADNATLPHYAEALYTAIEALSQQTIPLGAHVYTRNEAHKKVYPADEYELLGYEITIHGTWALLHPVSFSGIIGRHRIENLYLTREAAEHAE